MADEGNYLHYWYMALSTPYGIELVCSSPSATRSKLFAARRESRDPDLEAITCHPSPFDAARLWLVRRTNEAT